jgi:hypothetical protein
MSATEANSIELKTGGSSAPAHDLITQVGRHAPRTPALSDLIRYRYNTMAYETAGGKWKWRVVLEGANGFEEVLVKRLIVNVPSFTREDDMPVVGWKYHMAVAGDSASQMASESSIHRAHRA